MEGNVEEKGKVPPLAEGPWLITTQDEEQTFWTSNKSYVKTIPALGDNYILGVDQDWLVLRDRQIDSIYSLWNPVTSQFISLPELLGYPELEDGKEPRACFFMSSLDDDNINIKTYVLVLIFEGGLVFSCRTTLSHSYIWVKQTLELTDGIPVNIFSAVVFEGVIYAYTMDYVDMPFLRMKVAHDSSNTITLERMTSKAPDLEIRYQDHAFQIYMVESYGILYLVRTILRGYDNTCMDIVKALVWRLDFSNMEWIRIESLRNRALLLAASGCTWCWAGVRSSSSASGTLIQDNCLVLENDQRIYSYNLMDDSYTIMLPHPSFIQSLYAPTWFMPLNHQRVSPMEGGQFINEKTEHIQQINQESCEDGEVINELQAPSLLLELPTEILLSISSRHMNLFDNMNLRATCKTLYQADLVSNWRASSSYPLFLVRKDSKGAYELLDPYENISHAISTFDNCPNSLSNFECCKDGWLLLRNEEGTLQYLNPFTQKAGMYPPLIESTHSFLFSTSPDSPACLTIGIAGWEPIIIRYFDYANQEWLEYEMGMTDIPFNSNCKFSTKYYKDAFYLTGEDGCLGVLKIDQGRFKWHVHKSPIDRDIIIDSSYLVELDGELVSVFIGEYGTWLRLFKFDTSKESWLELDTLGDHILFLSRASSFSAKSKEGEIRNIIYLPWSMRNEIVFYSLDTRKYHTLGSANSKVDFYGMKAQSSCCWI